MALLSPSERLTQELSRFEAEMQETALAIVREVFAQELARRTDDDDEDDDEDEDDDDDDDEIAAAPAAAPAELAEPVTVPAAAAAAPKKRGWTRETVIHELSTWLLSGTAVEASFVRRHGQPGLAAAAKRIFGRFDAALNAANLHLAQQYPAGPPTRKPMTS